MNKDSESKEVADTDAERLIEDASVYVRVHRNPEQDSPESAEASLRLIQRLAAALAAATAENERLEEQLRLTRDARGRLVAENVALASRVPQPDPKEEE